MKKRRLQREKTLTELVNEFIWWLYLYRPPVTLWLNVAIVYTVIYNCLTGCVQLHQHVTSISQYFPLLACMTNLYTVLQIESEQLEWQHFKRPRLKELIQKQILAARTQKIRQQHVESLNVAIEELRKHYDEKRQEGMEKLVGVCIYLCTSQQKQSCQMSKISIFLSHIKWTFLLQSAREMSAFLAAFWMAWDQQLNQFLIFQERNFESHIVRVGKVSPDKLVEIFEEIDSSTYT